MKIVINADYGGYNSSIVNEVVNLYRSLKGDSTLDWSEIARVARNDPTLIEVVETLKDKANYCSDLKIVEIPDDVEWQIEEYDGWEWVAEKHRTWGWEGF